MARRKGGTALHGGRAPVIIACWETWLSPRGERLFRVAGHRGVRPGVSRCCRGQSQFLLEGTALQGGRAPWGQTGRLPMLSGTVPVRLGGYGSSGWPGTVGLGRASLGTTEDYPSIRDTCGLRLRRANDVVGVRIWLWVRLLKNRWVGLGVVVDDDGSEQHSGHGSAVRLTLVRLFHRQVGVVKVHWQVVDVVF